MQHVRRGGDGGRPPAWCPQCRASYCPSHWRTEVAGADDHPGWYEATYGTCPEGHRRILDD